MVHSRQGKWQSVLLLPLIIYLLLPFFGDAWHDVVPEHEHLFLNQSDSPDSVASVTGGDDSLTICAACNKLQAPLRTVVHAYNPASAFQVFGILLSLSGSPALVPPRGPFTRVMHPTLFPRAARLAPQDPPPNDVRFSA